MTFLTEGDNLAATPAWNNNNMKRVVRFTIAAEAICLQVAISYGFCLRVSLIEILWVDREDIPIKAYTNLRNLHEAAYSTKLAEDKKLRCDIVKIQENIHVKNVNLIWVKMEMMLTDCLTKQEMNSDKLERTLTTGRIVNEMKESRKKKGKKRLELDNC